MSSTKSISPGRRCSTVTIALVLGLLSASTVRGQGVPNDTRSAGATRGELETLSASLQKELRSDSANQVRRDSLTAEAQEIDRRLREGDFAPGDRIVIHVQGEPTLNDTLTVRDEQLLLLPGYPDLPLHGVLRSELRDRVEAHLTRFLREPQFSVTPLIRVAVVGEVARPGFYSLAPDARIGDAIMLAGGPTGSGDIGRLTLSHGGRRLLTERQMKDVIARGMSLNGVGVLPGDELTIGQRPRHDAQIYFQVSTVLLSALVAWATLSRRH